MACVSIPFKRERGEKAIFMKVTSSSSAEKFQFPSNGNAEKKVNMSLDIAVKNQFQFPSNGNADRDEPSAISNQQPQQRRKRTEHLFSSLTAESRQPTAIHERKVVIQEFLFQFPSNGNAEKKSSIEKSAQPISICFNSLQTGNQRQSVEHERKVVIQEFLFQFPSNGNAEKKSEFRGTNLMLKLDLFQFPSNGNAEKKERRLD